MHLFTLSLYEIGPLLCWGSITIWVSGSYPCVITRGPSPPQATHPPPISAPHWGPFRPPVGGSNRYASQTSKVMLTSSSTREQAVKHSGLEGFFRASFFRQELLWFPEVPAIHSEPLNRKIAVYFRWNITAVSLHFSCWFRSGVSGSDADGI